MKKRTLSLICVLSIILSIVAIPQIVSAVETTALSPASTLPYAAFGQIKAYDETDSLIRNYSLTDENVRFIGRNDINSYGRALYWPGTGFEFEFKGTSADVYVSHITNEAYFNVIIDGGTPKRIQLATGWNSIAKDLTDAEHTVKFIRSSEAVDGRAYFGDLRIEGASLSPTQAPHRKIEFYGDSFTVGYGNIETRMSAPKSAVNTDNYYSYASIASRQLWAESSIIASSGRGVAINSSGTTTSTIPDISVYGDVPTYTDTYEEWDYTKYTPQVIVVFLGINDRFGQSKSGIKDPTSYITEKYTDFITSLREKHNDAHIILCSRESDCSEDSIDATYNELSKNDSKIHRLVFNPCPANGLNGHPKVAEHEIIAEQLVTKINSIDDVWGQASVANEYELMDAKIVTETNTATVTAKKISADKSTTIKAFAATYDKDDRFVGIKIFNIDKSANETPLSMPITSDDVKSVKWFIWEIDGRYSPVAMSVETEL